MVDALVRYGAQEGCRQCLVSMQPTVHSSLAFETSLYRQSLYMNSFYSLSLCALKLADTHCTPLHLTDNMAITCCVSGLSAGMELLQPVARSEGILVLFLSMHNNVTVDIHTVLAYCAHLY